MNAQAKTDMIEALELFNNKANKLARSKLVEMMFGTDTGFTISQNAGEPMQITSRGPDETAIDAFVLTFRFFYQPGERSSFGKVADYYRTSDIDNDLKDKFIACFGAFLHSLSIKHTPFGGCKERSTISH